MIKQYRFKNRDAFIEFRDTVHYQVENLKITNYITDFGRYDFDRPFLLTKRYNPTGFYITNSQGEDLLSGYCTSFSENEVKRYLELVEPASIKTVHISENKDWDIKIEGNFDKEGIQSIITKLEGLLK